MTRPGVDTRSSYKEFTVQSVTKDSIRRNVAEAANMGISPEPSHSPGAQSGTDRSGSAKIGIFTGCLGALASRLVDRGCVAGREEHLTREGCDRLQVQTGVERMVKRGRGGKGKISMALTSLLFMCYLQWKNFF